MLSQQNFNQLKIDLVQDRNRKISDLHISDRCSSLQFVENKCKTGRVTARGCSAVS